ncbi:MAG: dockerin type I domain-containing protein [Chthoniobacterales bacterium]
MVLPFLLLFVLLFPAQAQTPAVLANISTRLRVETGDNVLIGGFIVTGTQPKKVIVRALGPSLNVQGMPIAGRLQDTTVELVGPGGSIAMNDNWRTGGQEAEIIASTVPPPSDLESAVVATLPAFGTPYTVIVRGVGGSSGVGQVEVFDLDQNIDAQLANISTRGRVQTGDDVMIGGFILVGSVPRTVIVRALGPSLPVTGALADPTLDLVDQNGMVLAANDNWRSSQEAEIIATTVPPTNDLESAIVATLAGAPYAAVVRGKNGATGVGAVEVFALNLPKAVSRKIHAGVPYDIGLPLNGNSGVECRLGGATNDHQIIVTFSSAVMFANASVSRGTGSVSSATGSGTNTITVNLTGVTNAQRLAVLLTGVNDGSRTFNLSIPMGVLLGDTNGSGAVSASDISQTRSAAQSGIVSPDTFRTDVNVSGAVNASDVGLVETFVGTVLPP